MGFLLKENERTSEEESGIAVLDSCGRMETNEDMNVQIASTLKVLSQSGKDKNVQVRGLRFLFDSCNDGFGCRALIITRTR